MNEFEKSLVGSIPLGEACEFFIKLKYGSAGSQASPEEVFADFEQLDKEAQAEILKEAGVELGEEKTASAKQAYAEKMLPGTERYYSDRFLSVLQGLPAKVYTPEGVDYTTIDGEKLAAKTPKERVDAEEAALQAEGFNDRDTARHNAFYYTHVLPREGWSHQAAELVRDNTAQNSPMIGGLGGAAVGGLAGGLAGRSGAGALLGAAAGGVLGAAGGAVHRSMAQSSAFDRTLANQRRAHGIDAYLQPGRHTAASGAPLPEEWKTAAAFKVALDQNPDIQAYLQAERDGMSAQNQNETSFMRDRMMQMQSQMATAQEGQMSTQQQMMNLEQQMAASQQQIQLAQQSAMDAQSMATQAQQGQISATDEAMRNAQLAAQMRMAYQQLRSQMMDVVSQDPASGLADQLKGVGMPDPMASMGATPQDPNAGAAQPQPDAAKPEGESGQANQNAKSEDSSPSSTTSSSEKKEASPRDRLMGAAVGAGIGALGTAMEARQGSGDLRKRVQQMEGQEGGFIHALNLAQQKARLALSEATEKHPGAAVLTGSLVGAGIGAGAAPAVRELVSK